MRDFRACNAKKVKRAAFQKHHTALCNEARYITSAAPPDTHHTSTGGLAAIHWYTDTSQSSTSNGPCKLAQYMSSPPAPPSSPWPNESPHPVLVNWCLTFYT